MTRPMKIRHQSILSYIKNGSTLFNTIFLLLHFFFGFFFYNYDATILFYYNLISIAIYLIGYIVLYNNLSEQYSTMVNVEVYIFMLLCTICLGWSFGFQQYCIIFVSSLLFTDYCLNQEHKLQKQTIFTLTLVIGSYFLLRIWTYNHPCVYSIDNKLPAQGFFLINSVIAFSFLIAYSVLYSHTVLRLEQTLIDVANKDALTGLYNRRKMQDLLKAMTEVMNTNGHQMCLAMMDIDNFKRINDTYGHDIGDQVLKSAANILLEKSTNTEGFYSCRWGGEEFLILYRTPYTNTQDAILEFDALREQIAETKVLLSNHEIRFTITTGLTFYKENISVYEMIKQADENLYYGKNNGKNVVICK